MLPQRKPVSQKLVQPTVRGRDVILTVLHLLCFFFSYLAAFWTRFEFSPPPAYIELFWHTLPWIVGIKTLAFYFFGNFSGWLGFVTFGDLKALLRAALLAGGAILAVNALVLWSPRIPYVILVADVAFTVLTLGALRCSWRLWTEHRAAVNKRRANGHFSRRALLVGANRAGAILADQLRHSDRWPYQVVGFVDGDIALQGSRLAGVPVLGTIDQVHDVIVRHQITDVLMISGSVPGRQMRRLLDDCGRGVELKVIPGVDNLVEFSSRDIMVRPVEINDLLRREPVRLDDAVVGEMLTGRAVMVTGAGGSIGSELCRQILKFSPSHLILVERAESSLFYVERELLAQSLDTVIHACVVDILDRDRLRQIFERHQPDAIFHAAAYKHVPMMEVNPGEAIKNNVLGTKEVADLANEYQAKTFVFISTDKAVNPTSVMGATKHFAERYIHALSNESQTRFIAVRFGNVLGSAGSVVPIFQEQIRRGGPITITDPRMTRFFMTIPEATQLVLQAGAMGRGGEIFVLDMGEPVRIVDLAKDLIRLSCLDADEIELEYTGIRPGEKLFEELYFEDEETLPTAHEKLRAAYHRPYTMEAVLVTLNQLTALALRPDEEIRRELCAFVAATKAETTVPRKTKRRIGATFGLSVENALEVGHPHAEPPVAAEG